MYFESKSVRYLLWTFAFFELSALKLVEFIIPLVIFFVFTMGVKGLWQILKPIVERKPISELSGQIVAIDLAPWIVQLQCGSPFAPKSGHKSFRKGSIPDLKQNYLQNKFRETPAISKRFRNRRYLDDSFKECSELIQLMGLPVVKSNCEAETYCAELNSAGIVDGIVTDDGDALLYGAVCVYRNFNFNAQVKTFDCYKMETIEKNLKLNRKKLVALALTLGCDYCPKGIPGVGKATALKFFETLDEDADVLIRFKNWSLNKDQTSCPKSEAFIKAKAMKMADFPNQDIVSEYLRPRNAPVNMKKENIFWTQPCLTPLHRFLSTKLNWPDDYIVGKVVPLIILWNFRNTDSSDCWSQIIAQKIIKKRTKGKAPVYEVQWEKLVADVWTEKEFYVTMEDKNLVDNAFPGLITEFEISLKKPSSKKTKVPCESKICFVK